MKRINSGSCNIKYVDAHRVGAYLSSYLRSKEHEWFLPKGKKHYSTSRNVHFEDYVPTDTWVYSGNCLLSTILEKMVYPSLHNPIYKKYLLPLSKRICNNE